MAGAKNSRFHWVENLDLLNSDHNLNRFFFNNASKRLIFPMVVIFKVLKDNPNCHVPENYLVYLNPLTSFKEFKPRLRKLFFSEDWDKEFSLLDEINANMENNASILHSQIASLPTIIFSHNLIAKMTWFFTKKIEINKIFK